MKRALIFGAGGFVGPYMASELKNNDYEVFGTDTHASKNPFLFDEYAICNNLDRDATAKIIKKFKPTHIINLAAISSVGKSWSIPEITMQVNVNGTLNIFNGCIESVIKPSILLIGSSEEYVSCNYPMDENVRINSQNPYGISKVAQEMFAHIFQNKYNWNIFCVRSFNHIGVGHNDSFVIPHWCKQMAEITNSGKDGVVKVGNIDVFRDFTDVKDIVRAYRLVIESEDCSEIYNIGSGVSFLLKDILKEIISLSPRKITIETDDSLLRPNDTPYVCCNNSKISKNLGWLPKIALYDSLKNIYESFK